MSKHEDVKGFHGEDRKWNGPLLGVCINCNGAPKMQKNRTWSTFRVICRCGNKTMDYGNMVLAAQAWNGKNERKVGQ